MQLHITRKKSKEEQGWNGMLMVNKIIIVRVM